MPKTCSTLSMLRLSTLTVMGRGKKDRCRHRINRRLVYSRGLSIFTISHGFINRSLKSVFWVRSLFCSAPNFCIQSDWNRRGFLWVLWRMGKSNPTFIASSTAVSTADALCYATEKTNDKLLKKAISVLALPWAGAKIRPATKSWPNNRSRWFWNFHTIQMIYFLICV